MRLSGEDAGTTLFTGVIIAARTAVILILAIRARSPGAGAFTTRVHRRIDHRYVP